MSLLDALFANISLSSARVTVSADGTLSDPEFPNATLVIITNTSGADRTVRGFNRLEANGLNQPVQTIRNDSASTYNVILAHEDAAESTAKRRLSLPSGANVVLKPGDSIECRYDATAQRLVGGGGQITPRSKAVSVDVSHFNILPTNDAATNTTNMLALRTYLRANPGLTVVFPPGDYVFLDPKWLKGVRDVKVLAYGATFTNQTAGAAFESVPLQLNSSVFNTHGDDAFSAGSYEYGGLIDTVAAGSDTIVFKSAGYAAATFAAGNRVLVHGYCRHSVSYPPSPLYFEIRTVLSVDSGANSITLTESLTYSYREDWWDFTFGQGAARCMPLTRADLQWANTIEICGAEFKAYSGWANATNGKVQAEGADRIILRDVKAPLLVPSVAGVVECYNCQFDEVETDKVLISVLYKDCAIKQHINGVGASLVKFDGGKYTGLFACAARQTIIDGSAEFSGIGVVSGIAVIGTAGGFAVESFDVRSAIINPRNPASYGIVTGGEEKTLTIASVESETLVTVAAASDAAAEAVVQNLNGGMTVRTDGGKKIVVEDIYDFGGGALGIIGEQLGGAPTIGDVYKWPNVQSITIDDDKVVVVGRKLRDRIAFPRMQRVRIQGAHNVITLTDEEVPRPATGGALEVKDIHVRSRLKSIYVDVQQAYTGASTQAILLIQNQGVATLATINLKVAGARYITEFAAQGAASGDTISAMSANSRMKIVRTYINGDGGVYLLYGSARELPLFTVVLEFVATR